MDTSESFNGHALKTAPGTTLLAARLPAQGISISCSGPAPKTVRGTGQLARELRTADISTSFSVRELTAAVGAT